MASTARSRKRVSSASAPAKRRAAVTSVKERVLIEFPSTALRRAEQAARAEGVSRSEFIRSAVEAQLDAIAEAEFERELEESYKANAAFSLKILKEFEHVDREGFEAIP